MTLIKPSILNLRQMYEVPYVTCLRQQTLANTITDTKVSPHLYMLSWSQLILYMQNWSVKLKV